MRFKIVYEIGIGGLEVVLWLMAAFSSKVRRMLLGRKQTIKRLQKFKNESPDNPVCWFHAASVGEFEQALPVIKLLKSENEDLQIAVSFFSPSGYELKYKHPLIDVAFYLPGDRTWNASKIIKILKPQFLVLVKYEFWYNLIFTCKRLNVPVISICCILKNQTFQKFGYGEILKKTLPLIDHFFVQNIETSQVIRSLNLQNFTINGDTRVDRVLEIKESGAEIPWLEEWKGNCKLLIVGSAWIEDLLYLRDFLKHAVVEAHGLWKVLIVPHEIDEKHINNLTHSLQLPFELYSDWKVNHPETDIIVLNTLGLLSRSYRYADGAWIGGAFKSGLHNTLEAAVFNIPVGFGPKFEKFQEAKDLIEIGVARSFPGPVPVWEFFQQSTELEAEIQKLNQSSTLYFDRQKGASQVIVQYLLGLIGKTSR